MLDKTTVGVAKVVLKNFIKSLKEEYYRKFKKNSYLEVTGRSAVERTLFLICIKYASNGAF